MSWQLHAVESCNVFLGTIESKKIKSILPGGGGSTVRGTHYNGLVWIQHYEKNFLNNLECEKFSRLLIGRTILIMIFQTVYSYSIQLLTT